VRLECDKNKLAFEAKLRKIAKAKTPITRKSESAMKFGILLAVPLLAKRLECDEDKGRFEAKLGKIAKVAVKPAKRK
jgi:hypothetical protein